VEMRYAVEDPIEILIPHVYGAELAAAKQSKSKAKDWTADRVLKVLADSGTDESVIRNITRLVEWCQSNGANFNPGVTPRVGISFETGDKETTVLMIGAQPPTVEVCFAYLKNAGVVPGKLAAFLSDLSVTEFGPYLTDVAEHDFRIIPKVPADEALGKEGAAEPIISALIGLLSFKARVGFLGSWEVSECEREGYRARTSIMRGAGRGTCRNNPTLAGDASALTPLSLSSMSSWPPS
jgi:hypothetical protein